MMVAGIRPTRGREAATPLAIGIVAVAPPLLLVATEFSTVASVDVADTLRGDPGLRPGLWRTAAR